MKIMLDKLITLADGLDSLGLKKDADVLDQIIAKVAAGQDDPGEFGDLMKLFDEPVEFELKEEKGPVEERRVLEEPEVHTPLTEEEAPLSKEKTGPSRLDMIKRRHDLMKLKQQMEQEEKGETEEAPVDVINLPVATPEELSFEDEDDMNEADDGGLFAELKEKLKAAPELLGKVLQIVKDNPELLELLAL